MSADTLRPVAISVPSEDALSDLLTGLNVSGIHPELPCVWSKDIGSPGHPNLCQAPFLATLTDPDADHVNYIVSDESGYSRCMVRCDNCGSEGNEDWGPPEYPVTALVAFWPDADRCREDEIRTWWIAPAPGHNVADMRCAVRSTSDEASFLAWCPICSPEQYARARGQQS